MKDAAKISVWLLQRDFYGLTERFYWRWWWGGFLVFSYWISWDEPKIVWASKLWIPNTIIFREKLLSKQQKKLQHNFNFDKFVSGLGWLSVGFLKLIFWLLLYFVSGYNWNAFSSIQNWWVSWLELRRSWISIVRIQINWRNSHHSLVTSWSHYIYVRIMLR